MTEYLSKGFVPQDTKDANLAKAEHWLNLALRQEALGKGKGLIDKALDKACDYETAAFA